MNNIFLLLTIIGLLGIPVCLILTIIRLFKKKKIKPSVIGCAISVIICIVCFIGFGLTVPDNLAIESSTKITESSTSQKENEIVRPTENASAVNETTVAETSAIIETTPISESVTPEPSSVEESSAPLSEKEVFIMSLTSNPDITTEAASSAYDILTDKLGFEKITVDKNISGTLYEIRADDYNLKVTLSDKLYMVICGDYNLYQEDTVKYTKQSLEDRKIGNNGSGYYAMAVEAISANLKNPSSAHFGSMESCQIGRNREYVVVKGYVDAANSFNTQVRNEFVVELRVIDLASYLYEIIYLNINGESTGTYIDIK